MGRTAASDGNQLPPVSYIRDVVDLMRDKGVMRMIVGPLDVFLGPVPAKPGQEPKKDPQAERRAHYEMQLGRPISDEDLKHLP